MKPSYGQGASLGDAIAEHNRTILELMGKIPPRPVDYYPYPTVYAPTIPSVAKTISNVQKGVKIAKKVGQAAKVAMSKNPAQALAQSVQRRLSKKKPVVASAPETE